MNNFMCDNFYGRDKKGCNSRSLSLSLCPHSVHAGKLKINKTLK